MKRLLTMSLLCLALVTLLYAGAGSATVKADSDGNDTFQRATKITSKNSLTGILSDKDDKDWFAYTVEEDGPFYFSFANASDSKAQWSLEVYDNDVAKMNGYVNQSSEVIDTRLYSFKKGCVIYVCITHYMENAINKEYSLQVIRGTEKKYGYDLSGLWESEDNDSKKIANNIDKNNPIYGMLCVKDDKDVYKYKIVGDGTFSIRLENQTEYSAQWNLTIYDSEYNQIKKCTNSPKEFTINTDSLQGNVGEIVYIEIRKEWDECIGLPYLLSVMDNSKDESSNLGESFSTPYSVLAGTNVVVGKAEAGATVNVKYGKKTYKATADENGIYRVKTVKLKKGKKVTIWQTVGKTSSEKISVKVVEKY